MGYNSRMAFEKIDVLEGQKITPEAVVAKVRGMIDEVVWEVFEKHVAMLVDWVRKRLEDLPGDGKEVNRVEFGLNAYNRTLGFGLQSVSVGFRHDNEAMRYDNEFKDPTIGVIAPGLVGEGAVYQVVTFPVDWGKMEIIKPDEGLAIDEANPDNLMGLPAKSGQVMVQGPNHAKTVVQVRADKVDASQIERKPNSGVYTCGNVNIGDED